MKLNILYGSLDKAWKGSQVLFCSSISTTCVPEELMKRRLGLIQNYFNYCNKSYFDDSTAFSFQGKYLHNAASTDFFFKEEREKDQTDIHEALPDHTEKLICPKPQGNGKPSGLQMCKEKTNTNFVNPRSNNRSKHQNLVWAKQSRNETFSQNKNVDYVFLNKTFNETNEKIEKEKKTNMLYSSHKNKENQNSKIGMTSCSSKNILKIDIFPNCKDVTSANTQSIQFETINNHNNKQNLKSNVTKIDNAKKLNTAKELSFNCNLNNKELTKDKDKMIKLISTNSKNKLGENKNSISDLLVKKSSVSNEKVDLTENISHLLSSKLNERSVIEVKQIPPKNRSNNDLKNLKNFNCTLNINPKFIKSEKGIRMNGTYNVQQVKTENMFNNIMWLLLHSKRKMQMNVAKKNENILENKIETYYKNIDLKQKPKSINLINTILRPAKPEEKVNKYQCFKQETGSLTAPSEYLTEKREVVNYQQPIINTKLMQMIGVLSFQNKPLYALNNVNNFNAPSNNTGNLTVDRNELKKKISLSKSNRKDLTMGLKSEIKCWKMYHKLKQTSQKSISQLYKNIMVQRKFNKPTKKNVVPLRKNERKKCTVISIPLKPCPTVNEQFQNTIHTTMKSNFKNSTNIQLSKLDPTNVMMNKYNKRHTRNCNSFNDIVKKNEILIFKKKFKEKDTTELESNKLIMKEILTKNKGKISKRAKLKNEYSKKVGNKHLKTLLKNSKKINVKNKVPMVKYIHQTDQDNKMDSSEIKEINTYPSGYLKRPEFIIQLISLNENESVIEKSEEKDTGFKKKQNVLENQAHNKSDEICNKDLNEIIDKPYEKVGNSVLNESKSKPVGLEKTDYKKNECELIRESTSKCKEDMIKTLEVELDRIKNSQIRKIWSFINEQIGPCMPQKNLTTTKSYNKLCNSPLDENCISYKITDGEEQVVKNEDNNNQLDKPKKVIKVGSSAAESEQLVNTDLHRHKKENISKEFQHENEAPNNKVSNSIQNYFENKNNLFKGNIATNDKKKQVSIHQIDNFQFQKSLKGLQKDENKKNYIKEHVFSNISHEENQTSNISIIQQLPKQTTTIDKQKQPNVSIYEQQRESIQTTPFTSQQKELAQVISLEEAKLNFTKQHPEQAIPYNMTTMSSNPLIPELTNEALAKHQNNIPTTDQQMKPCATDKQESKKNVTNIPDKKHLELFNSNILNKQIQSQSIEKEQSAVTTYTTRSNGKFDLPSCYLNEVKKKRNNFGSETDRPSNDTKTSKSIDNKQLIEEQKSEFEQFPNNKNMLGSNTQEVNQNSQTDYSRTTLSQDNVNNTNLIDQIIPNKEYHKSSNPTMTLHEKLGFECKNPIEKQCMLKRSAKKSSSVDLNLNINKELLDSIKKFFSSCYLKLTNTLQKEQTKKHRNVSAGDLLDNNLNKNKSYSLPEVRTMLNKKDETFGIHKNQMAENGIKKSISDDLFKYRTSYSEYERKLSNLLPKETEDHLLPSEEKYKQSPLNNISTTNEVTTADSSQTFNKQVSTSCEHILSKKNNCCCLLNKANEKDLDKFSSNQVKHQRTFCNLNNFENSYKKLYEKDILSCQQKKWNMIHINPRIITKKSKAVYEYMNDKTLFNQILKFPKVKCENSIKNGIPVFQWKSEAKLHLIKNSKIKNHHSKFISSKNARELNLMQTLNSIKNSKCSTRFDDYYHPESYWLDYNPQNFFNANKKANNEFIKKIKKKKEYKKT